MILTLCGRPYDRAYLRNQQAQEAFVKMTRLWQTNSIDSSLLLEKTTLDKIQSLADECGYIPSHASFVPIQYPLSEQFTFRNVECCEIERVVKSLANNKAPGTDKIPSRVITESAPVIIPSITSIINSSFNSGVFPGA